MRKLLLLAALFPSIAFAGYVPPNDQLGWPPLKESKRFLITLDACSGGINTTGIDEWVNTSTTGAIEEFDGTDIATAPCMVQFDIGAAAGNDASVRTAGTGTFTFAQGTMRFFAYVQETAVSNSAANGYVAIAGFTDADANSGGTAGTDGCFFRYSDNINSGKWQGVCEGANTESTVDTGITYTAGTMRQLAVVVNAAGTSVQFYVDGVATGAAITGANIPTGVGESTGCGMTVAREEGSTADTEPIALDYMACQIDWTTPPWIQVP